MLDNDFKTKKGAMIDLDEIPEDEAVMNFDQEKIMNQVQISTDFVDDDRARVGTFVESSGFGNRLSFDTEEDKHRQTSIAVKNLELSPRGN